ncbi:hypothetical protein [Dietzia kunjamensis]|uniref:hypothetical protein n=1 Tax=Dietzia kunjamensis TaxID=322509 RepID=UPI0039BD8261
MALHPSLSPTVARWNTRFANDHGPLNDYELDYVLDGDDPVAVAARASVVIAAPDPDIAAIAARSGLDYAETADILDGFRSALRRAEGGAA